MKRNAARERSTTRRFELLGRHLSRIIYKMLKEERDYEIRPEKGNTKTKVSPRSFVKTQIRRPKISSKKTK